MIEAQRFDAGDRRTRRNIMKMGAILASSAVARAHAANLSVVCHTPAARNFACNCFLKGTRIRTAEGERKVEDLASGDLLPTVFGGLRPIRWVGRYPVKRSDPSKHWVKDVLPIRISRSALAPDVPHTDLYVTEGHSLLIGPVAEVVGIGLA
jgi:Hint domain